jgi:hypothetical protein
VQAFKKRGVIVCANPPPPPHPSPLTLHPARVLSVLRLMKLSPAPCRSSVRLLASATVISRLAPLERQVLHSPQSS